jgi:hypothetical protein
VSPTFLPFTLEKRGKIEGLVYDEDMNPVSGVMVVVYDRYGFATGYGKTDIRGRYEISNLPFGYYFVQIHSGEIYGTTQKYAGQYYKDAYTWREAKLIILRTTEGEGYTNFILKKGGTIKGKLVDEEDNSPLREVSVSFILHKEKNLYINYFVITDSTGNFEIKGLEPGEYKIEIQANGWIREFYKDKKRWEEGEVVESKFDTVELEEIKLTKGKKIKGKITPTLKGTYVEVYGKESGMKVQVDSVGYLLKGLEEGEYYIKVIPPENTIYVNETKKVSLNHSDDEVVLDFTLKIGGVITGRVRDEEGNVVTNFEIKVYDKNSTPVSCRISYSSGGSYSIYGLPVGEYFLKITSFNPRTRISYIQEFYKDKRDIKNATPVKVRRGYRTEEIDFIVERGPFIEGYIFLNKDWISEEEVRVKVVAYNLETKEVFVTYNTFCGGYRLSSLSYGRYKIFAFAPNSNLPAIWFGGGKGINDKNTIEVKLHKPKGYNIDLSMGKGGCKVEGRVYSKDDVLIKHGTIGLYGKDGFIIETAEVRDGKYCLAGLFKGEYYLAFFFGEEEIYWYKGVVEKSKYNYPPSYILIPKEAISFTLEKNFKIDIMY